MRQIIIEGAVTLRGFSPKFLDRIQELCTIENPVYEAAERFTRWGEPQVAKTLDFWERIAPNELVLPRAAVELLPLKIRQKLAKYTPRDKRATNPVKFPKLRVTPNEEQATCLARLRKAQRAGTRPFGNYLFLASTAAGKTILQAAVAARLGQKTLVVCPTDQIMRAWYADLKFAFGLNPTQIGLIRASKFKTNGPFVLTTPQTLGRRSHRWPELFEMFGSIIVDETQIVTAPNLFEFLVQSPAQNLIGATATQQARVGINHHLRMLFGTPLVSLNTYGRDTATSMQLTAANLVTTDFRYNYQTDNLDWHDLIMALSTDDARNELVVANVLKDWSAKRVVLVVTRSLAHVELLTEMLREAGISNVNTITGATNSNRHYSKVLMQTIKSRRVTCIVASMNAIKIGANIPTLDSLHIVIPPANTRDVEQLIGRIRRKADGKKTATVTYYMDTHVGYLMRLYRRIINPVFIRLNLPGFV